MTDPRPRTTTGNRHAQRRIVRPADPTIAQAVANYLAGVSARRRRAAAWALELLVHCLNGYAYEALNPSEQRLFRRLFDAEDETHREYCEIFGPDKIAPELSQFFEWFLIRKVMAPAEDLKRIANEVGPFLAWLGAQGLAEIDAAAEGARLASLAAEIIPRAEAAASLLHDHLERQPPFPEEDALEGYFRIARVESSALWLEADEDGRIYGPVAIPATVGKRLAAGWALSGIVAPTHRGAKLVEVWNIYPDLTSAPLRARRDKGSR